MSDNNRGPRQRKPASGAAQATSGDNNASKARDGKLQTYRLEALIVEEILAELILKRVIRIAMFKRSKKVDNTMKQYYIVIGAFVGVCVLSVLYVLLNPKKSFAQMPVIDDTAILVHNGQ